MSSSSPRPLAQPSRAGRHIPSTLGATGVLLPPRRQRASHPLISQASSHPEIDENLVSDPAGVRVSQEHPGCAVEKDPASVVEPSTPHAAAHLAHKWFTCMLTFTSNRCPVEVLWGDAAPDAGRGLCAPSGAPAASWAEAVELHADDAASRINAAFMTLQDSLLVPVPCCREFGFMKSMGGQHGMPAWDASSCAGTAHELDRHPLRGHPGALWS